MSDQSEALAAAETAEVEAENGGAKPRRHPLITDAQQADAQRQLARAVDICNGQSQLARQINKAMMQEYRAALALNDESPESAFELRVATQQKVFRWLNETLKIPPEVCRFVEIATGGQVLRSQLRPDVFPPIEYALLRAGKRAALNLGWDPHADLSWHPYPEIVTRRS